MDTLIGIKVFLQVVESGSFVAAADRLDVSTAMVSKHVINVEQRLGMRVLNCNSRTLSLTEPGRIYFERCKVILDDLEEAELELGSLGSNPRGTLRVTCPSWFASQRVARLLARYRAQFPEIVVDVSFQDRFIDLVEDGYDLAPLTDFPLWQTTLYMVYISRKYVPLKIRSFMDFLLEFNASMKLSINDVVRHASGAD